MFEKFREAWTRATEPIVVKMGNLDPSILTWTSLVIAIVAFVLLAEAQFDETGGLMIIGGIVLIIVAGIFDALDGALARHQGTDGPYGDFLDHTIERVVDDISNKKRPAAEHAKDAGSAAVAITAIATGMVWIVTIFDLLSS